MVLEGGLPAPLQLYAAAAAQLAPRPAWPPFLPFFGVPPPFLARPRLPHPMPARAPHGPPSEDSNEDGGSSKGLPGNHMVYDARYVPTSRERGICTVKCKMCPEHKVRAKGYNVTLTV
ncbi:hypothetical protein MSG28_003983 [Choristoneura fumiferana]|uniref:Uncharacterized protein n=1 Tax=Choristoneura fumiferana TaxID=7141 RepID=A0ACC0KHQ6_CHOFU|nr:hypothetical protein MSG28_003983 [Choristoneura fumiferana]